MPMLARAVANVLRSLGADEVRSVIEEQGACTVTSSFWPEAFQVRRYRCGAPVRPGRAARRADSIN
jgi:hypothetical protein